MSVVKVVGLVYGGLGDGKDHRDGSAYPVSDQVIDVAVMAGVYAVILVLEMVLKMQSKWQVKQRKEVAEEEMVAGKF